MLSSLLCVPFFGGAKSITAKGYIGLNGFLFAIRKRMTIWIFGILLILIKLYWCILSNQCSLVNRVYTAIFPISLFMLFSQSVFFKGGQRTKFILYMEFSFVGSGVACKQASLEC